MVLLKRAAAGESCLGSKAQGDEHALGAAASRGGEAVRARGRYCGIDTNLPRAAVRCTAAEGGSNMLSFIFS